MDAATVSFVLVIIAALMNTYVSIRSIRSSRRRRDEMEKLLLFAAFMSREESGAPEAVREMARAALPEGATIELVKFPPSSSSVH